MGYFIPAIIFLTVFLFGCCKKNSIADCSSNAATTRQITDRAATIKASGSQFFIFEQGSIDTKLNPCNLPEEYRQDNLKVIVSGDVKYTSQRGTVVVCCTENFVISKISK